MSPDSVLHVSGARYLHPANRSANVRLITIQM